MHISRTVRCLISAAVFFLALNASAQPPRQPPSPVLLKRLAEAVDGNRTGTAVYVVASYDSLSPVRGVFSTRKEADILANRLGSSYDVFGPFMAPREMRSTWFMICKHDRVGSWMDDICPPPQFPVDSLADLTLTARLKDGTTRVIPLGPGVDAVFMSLPAIDKFAIPYYARTLGVDSAAAMRRRIAGGIRIR